MRQLSIGEKQGGAALKRDRWVVLAGLIGASALPWAYTTYLLARSQDMMAMEPAMPQMSAWGSAELALTFGMWAVMMVAMMLPSMAPAALLFVSILRSRPEPRGAGISTTALIAGYLSVWLGFAALATVAQWALHVTPLSPGLLHAGPILGAALLVSAGLFQWSPLKHACLARCRSPQGFFMTEWRDGLRGAWQMGLKQGVFCLGCCWLLMSLMMLTGAMSLLWMAMLAAFILLEKLAPASGWVSRLGGLVLVGWGLWLAATTLAA